MALDIRKLTPASAVRLLNSTNLGTVLTERQLYRHRQEAGLRIGDGETIHLLRYAAWLVERLDSRQLPSENDMAKAKTKTEGLFHEKYERHRTAAADRQAKIAAAGQEIGSPPAVADPKRREACRLSFRLFCETYFDKVFYLGWSDDHLRVIKKIEDCVLSGALCAIAMPRGSGKTWMCLAAVLWATLYGHHKFVTLIAATDKVARRLLRRLYNRLQRDKLLLEDFPEVCFPITKLGRSPARAMKQKCEGEFTEMVWTAEEMVLPKMKGSLASGTIITCCGLTGGEVRGQTREGSKGEALRPTLVLLDDPQTKSSAKSKTETEDRVELLQGDVLGMAGPDSEIAGMLTCTVIRPGDMADQILNREENPSWNGERTRLVYAWPVNEVLWDEYANLRADGLRRGDKGAAATEFYRQNRAAMDIGAVVAWAQRHPPSCLSAIQNAVNLRLRNAQAFAAEYQNEPLKPDANAEILTAEQISAKLNHRKPGTVPTPTRRLVMYVDVHKKLLYYVVLALEADFTGCVVEYGAWPEQRLTQFEYRNVRKTLMVQYAAQSPKDKGKSEPAAIYAGLCDLAERTLGRTWARDDGAGMKISLCLIDAGYQKDSVELFCRQGKHLGLVLPAKGIPITSWSKPLEEGGKAGEEKGIGYRVTLAQGKHSVPLVLLDSNRWKSFLHERLAAGIGDHGCLSLFGGSEIAHKLFAEHLTAETPFYPEKGDGRRAEWKLPSHRPDNHWLDCAAGACAAGAILGLSLLQPALPKTQRTSSSKRRPKPDPRNRVLYV